MSEFEVFRSVHLEKPVGNLSNYRDKIIAAMDMLVTGI
jgi:hypothetical protein